MNAQRQLTFLAICAGTLLVTCAVLSAWLSAVVLNPLANADYNASGASVSSAARVYFKTPALSGVSGQTLQVQLIVDSNGGSLADLETTLHYSPVDLTVSFVASAQSVCNGFTRKEQNITAGTFTLGCTAPSGAGTAQIAPFVTFVVTPLHAGVFPISLSGRHGDYAVVRAE